jgi:hypothetical protein
MAIKYNDPNIVIGGANYVAKYYPWTSAGSWWNDHHMNRLVDNGGTVTDVSRRVNGKIVPGTHLPDRINNFNQASKIFTSVTPSTSPVNPAPKPINPVNPTPKPVNPVNPVNPTPKPVNPVNPVPIAPITPGKPTGLEGIKPGAKISLA